MYSYSTIVHYSDISDRAMPQCFGSLLAANSKYTTDKLNKGDAMETSKKQKLVLVGIRRKGESRFTIKSSFHLSKSHPESQLLLKLAR